MSVSKDKKARRELALKRAKKNRILIIIACVLVVAGIVTFIVLESIRKSKAEIYSSNGQYIHLFDDGSFSATLSHSKSMSGKYTKDGDKVIFTVKNGDIVEGSISGGSLNLPSEWDDGHGHGSSFPRENP